MKLLILVPILFLTGCGCTSHCILGFGPGNPAFNAMGRHYDTLDSCQYVGKPEGYQLPGFCFKKNHRLKVQTLTIKVTTPIDKSIFNDIP